MFLENAKKIPNVVLQVLILFSFTLARWAIKRIWAMMKRRKLRKSPILKGFSPLIGKRTESAKKKEERTSSLRRMKTC
jgi:hypothetical protein